MKRRIDNYAFDADPGTLTFSGFTTIRLEAILIVVNVTDQLIIYSPFDAAKGGTAATNVLTFEHDTTTMSDGDDLLIYYDDSGDEKISKALINQTTAEVADVAIIAAPGANKIIVLHQVSALASGANTNDMELRMRLGATAATNDALSDNDVWHPGIPPGGGFVEPQYGLEGPANTAFNYQCSLPGGETAIKVIYHIKNQTSNP